MVEAFGGRGDVKRLAGGQGSTFACGDVVLKPALDATEAEWLAGVLHGLPPSDDVAVNRPVRAAAGRWVVDGWCAFARVDGEPNGARWHETLAASEAFHRLVAGVPWSPAMGTDHPWAVADGYAWGERRLTLPSPVDDLARRRVALDLPSQFVHGDLAGNVLFAAGGLPTVIDVSPMWRPARYGDAIAMVDAVAWAGAPSEALTALDDPVGRQLGLRAALFRIAVGFILGRHAETELERYTAVARTLLP